MIPVNEFELGEDYEIEMQPSETFFIESDRMISKCDNLQAVKQAVYLILNTERYSCVIYSDNYGVEFVDLIGQPIPYVLPELKRRIEEALTQDDRIESVNDFDFEVVRDTVTCTFKVQSIFGSFTQESEVQI